MKIIFLDIDGVLNSAQYDRQRTASDGNIDKTRLELLKVLVDETGAKIVLSSSWRKHWNKDIDKCDDVGKEIVSDFSESGLEIFDKTPFIGYLERSEEVRLWLHEHSDVERFVVFDDNGCGWGDLSNNFVQTNYRIGRGLEVDHINRALEILS